MNVAVERKEKEELCGFCSSSGIKNRFLNDYEEKCGDCVAGVPSEEVLMFLWLAAMDEVGSLAEMSGKMKAMSEPRPWVPAQDSERVKARNARKTLRDEMVNIASFRRRIETLEARIYA
jgi:hypothetical protein